MLKPACAGYSQGLSFPLTRKWKKDVLFPVYYITARPLQSIANPHKFSLFFVGFNHNPPCFSNFLFVFVIIIVLFICCDNK